ncbi:MAG: polysaccharide deacetylase family protein [Candidatus Pacebacteria bacterium]|nr:polysaccharide deacetylase family protein [Candidatus Paceibacterota bacterium]
MNKILFTTSWDDGSVLDLKIADLLSHYGMKGTFYIPKSFDGKNDKHSAYNRRLTENEICSIATSHEVGGHSLTHRRLTNISLEEARGEIFACKDFLDKVTGSPTKAFAYPGGEFDRQITGIVKEAGFKVARTTQKLTIQMTKGQFLMSPTIICQPFPFRKLDANRYYFGRILDPVNAYTPKQFVPSWQSLARKWFKKSLVEGSYFHLYGHSWELEKYGMWQELESFLKFVKEYGDVIYLSNSEVMEQV